MPHITIEYAIMLPLLVSQIFLFPLTASWIMNIWVDSRRALVLQDIAGHLGSTIQQLYSSLNHDTIPAGTTKYSTGLPSYVEDYPYEGTGALQTVLDPTLNSSKVLKLTISLGTTEISTTVSVILGSNFLWKQSTFVSNSTQACVSAEKFANGTISMCFGED